MPKNKLMIVDDQPEIRKMLRLALGKHEYQLLDAENGDAALAIAYAEKPDVVLLDVPAASILGEVLSAMQIDKARWPLILDLPAALPSVMADAAKLRQIFTNVLGNAVKYSPAGGAIAIQGVIDESGGKTRVGITVADHGIGMTPVQARRVCERFYRADTSGNIPGTGLGMAIVKEVIELLGGRIDISSAVGAGTTVTLWLPAAAVPSSQ